MLYETTILRRKARSSTSFNNMYRSLWRLISCVQSYICKCLYGYTYPNKCHPGITIFYFEIRRTCSSIFDRSLHNAGTTCFLSWVCASNGHNALCISYICKLKLYSTNYNWIFSCLQRATHLSSLSFLPHRLGKIRQF